MKNRPLVVRIAVLTISVSIVAVYVSCRSQDAKPAAGNTAATRETQFMGGSKNEAVFSPPPSPKQTMGGSKSLMIVKPTDLPPTQPSKSEPK